jgi:hypothetical protein
MAKRLTIEELQQMLQAALDAGDTKKAERIRTAMKFLPPAPTPTPAPMIPTPVTPTPTSKKPKAPKTAVAQLQKEQAMKKGKLAGAPSLKISKQGEKILDKLLKKKKKQIKKLTRRTKQSLKKQSRR